MHEVRGIKLANVHELDNDKAAQEMYDQALEFLDCNKLDPGQWFADVGLETFYLDHIICWFTDGHAELLRHLFPDMEDARLERMVHGSHFKKDQINLLSQASGFRLELPSTHAIRYISVYCTEKTASYQLHKGIYRRRRADELLQRQSHQGILDDLDKISAALLDCMGSERGAPQEGSA